MNDSQTAINFALHNVFVKDASFEAPNTPAIFAKFWLPRMSFDIEMARNAIEEDIYEVTVKISVQVIVVNDEADLTKEDATGDVAFIAEITQAGIFEVSNVQTAEQLDFIMGTTAPTLLFPYAREAIGNMVMKGGFPQFILPPINFEDMYRQHLAEQATSMHKHEDTVIQ